MFIASWVTAGVRTPDYSPIDEPISRLAASGAPHRALMTGGLTCFGLALPVFAAALRRTVAGPAWKVAVGNGLATLAVAALPLGDPDAFDVAHGAAALAAYANLTALPLLAAEPLRAAGHERAARLSKAAGLTVGACLLVSIAGSPVGLFQRAGLTIGHAWIVGTALAIRRWRPLQEEASSQ